MLEHLSVVQFAGIGAIGLAAGTLGGMLGVGGSVLMIPGLTWLLGPAQHLYQAAAMIANVAVSIPAVIRHRKAGMIVTPVLRWMLPAALLFIILGVAASNLPTFSGAAGGRWLGRILAVFLLYIAWINVLRLRKDPPLRSARAPDTTTPPTATATEENPADERLDLHNATPTRCSAVGAVMGGIAGLLGIGGGALAVPLQQSLLRLPLRNAIANSSAVICISATAGAAYKNLTLAQHSTADIPLTATTGLMLAALLAPTAWLGGRLGASLTYILPLRLVRSIFIVLMLASAWRMAV